MRARYFHEAAACLIISASVTRAFAQQQTSASDSPLIEPEIFVTAQKREQSAQDVGITLSTFSANMLKQAGVDDVADIARITPGVSISGSYAGQNVMFAIRGVTQKDFGVQAESPIAVYVDEGYMAANNISGIGLLDVDRVEVLKGPQGTLFGRNAMAISTNDQLAAAIGRHPKRFAGLACLAPQSPQAAAREMERAITDLKLNGFIINSHTSDLYLDDPRFAPVLEAAEALNRPIYLHPRAPSNGMAAPFRDYNLGGSIWGFGVEAGTHAVRLIMSGTFDHFPSYALY